MTLAIAMLVEAMEVYNALPQPTVIGTRLYAISFSLEEFIILKYLGIQGVSSSKLVAVANGISYLPPATIYLPPPSCAATPHGFVQLEIPFLEKKNKKTVLDCVKHGPTASSFPIFPT